jgi:hypothetical protein
MYDIQPHQSPQQILAALLQLVMSQYLARQAVRNQ